jgi:hypothetical protein
MNRADRIACLPILRRVAGERASALIFDWHTARVCYAIVSLDRDSIDDCVRLGRALASLGDRAGAVEVFQWAGALAHTKEDKRGVAAAYARAKEELQKAPAVATTLANLRAGGWAEVDRAITFAQTQRPERKCTKCGGWGYLQWFREHDRGRCYECNGTGYVR